VHRGDKGQYDVGSIPRLFKRVRPKVPVAVRKQRKRAGEAPPKGPVVSGEAFGQFLGTLAEDSLEALRAANTLCERFKEPVVIQEDLSVVLERHATKPIIERITP